MANQQSVTREQVQSDKFDRPANNEIVRVSSKKFVSCISVEEALAPWLGAVCGFEPGSFKISGGGRNGGRDFTIQFNLNPLANARRVDTCMSKLKDPETGEFKEFKAKLVGGGEETIRIDRDENSRSRTQRRMGAVMLAVLKEAHPELDNLHTRKDYKKSRVSIFNGQTGLVSMFPVSPNIEAGSFLWNPEGVVDSSEGTVSSDDTRISISKSAIIKETLRKLERPEDRIQWSL